MIRRPPRSTRTDTLFPYTTLFRSLDPGALSDTWNYDESPERYPYDTGLLRDVFEAATRGAGWGRSLPEGHGLGLAFCYSFMSYTAAVVEVAADEQGQIQVVAVDMAIDCGPQINPERIRAQMEGGAIMGLSLALSGEISFEQGRVKQSNFHDYDVMRHAAAPRQIRTHLVNDNHTVRSEERRVGKECVRPCRSRWS